MELLLKSQGKVPPREGLAERILAASLEVTPLIAEEPAELGFSDWLRGLWRPRPAFALASLLVLGFIAGFYLRADLSTSGTTPDLASLLYHEENVLW
ncbi:MAG: hypothetical protein K8R69_06730 [Deltaproteobacteria bacterium]|nr:hypothetical protein [Deltaproteobacteria bacterium]